MHWQRRVLFKGSLSKLCLLIAPLPWPHKQAWKAPLRQRGCHDKVHHRLASESAQPAGDVGRRVDGCVMTVLLSLAEHVLGRS
jgi:hypothetical protein